MLQKKAVVLRRMKKIAILVLNNFLHDSRVLRIARSLAQGGFAVTVVALHEGDLPEHEDMEGFHLHRIRLRTRPLAKFRLVQYLKWAELFFRVSWQYRSFDFMHCCDVLPLPIAIWTKRLYNRRLKVVYDAHELEFDKNTRNRSWGSFLASLEKRFIHQADAQFTVSDLIAEAYVEEYGVPLPTVLYNCPNYEEVPAADHFRKQFNIPADRVLLIYQGALLPNRGVDLLIRYMEYRNDDRLALIIMGYGQEKERLQAMAAGRTDVFFPPAVKPTELLPYTGSADIGAYFVQNTNRSHDLTVGNKLFEYMMAGLPVISSPLKGPEAILTEETGVILADQSLEALHAGVEHILERGLASYREALSKAGRIYNWEEQEKHLLSVYRSLS